MKKKERDSLLLELEELEKIIKSEKDVKPSDLLRLQNIRQKVITETKEVIFHLSKTKK